MPVTFARGKIHRARLVDLLLSHLSKKLVVIASPAGYGKTTLLADFTGHAGLPVCWVRLPEGLQDPIEVALLIRESLGLRFRRLRGRPSARALSGASPKGMAAILAALIETEVSEPFVLAIDDIHELNVSEGTRTFLDSFIERQPPQLTTIVAGREPPEISLAKLLADGDLAGIGPQDMAVTREEVIALFGAGQRAKASDEMIDSLLEQTHGWITGLILSDKLIQHEGTQEITRGKVPVYEYLATMVFNRLTDDMRAFLREASVLRVMTHEACDRILGRRDSGRYLGLLQRQALFVATAEGEVTTYELHPLFREFLRNELRSYDRKRAKLLQRRAADYLASQAAWGDAVLAYLDCGAIAEARKVAERGAAQYFREGRSGTLENWASRLRAAGSPSVSVLRFLAVSWADRGQLESADRAVEEIETLVGSSTPKVVLGAVWNLKGLIAFRRGDYRGTSLAVGQALKILKGLRGAAAHLGMAKRLHALALGGDGEYSDAERIVEEAVAVFEALGEDYSLAQALIDSHYYQLQQGKQLHAQRALGRAERILRTIEAPLPLAMIGNNAGILHHLRGNYEGALDQFARAARLARLAGSALTEAQVLLSQAELFSDIGLAAESGQLFQNSLDLAATIGDIDLLAVGCLGAAVLHRRSGNASLAADWLARAREFAKELPLVARSIEAQAALLDMSESPESLYSKLHKLEISPLAGIETRDRVLVQFYLARADSIRGRSDAWQSGVLKAVEFARRTGYLQIIAAELVWDDDLRAATLSALSPDKGKRELIDKLEGMKELARRDVAGPPSSEQLPSLQIRGFGPGAVLHKGTRIEGLKPLHREILFYIVDQKQADRDILVEEFWPEHAEGRRAANLHMAVYSLRRALGKEAIEFDGRYYSLGTQLTSEYDVSEFQRAATIAEQLLSSDPRRYFALTEAVDAYGDIFLSQSDSPWVVAKRRELEASFVRLAEAYADQAEQRGNRVAAIEVLRRALSVDPLRDSLNLGYIQALGRMGRRTDIVLHYTSYVRMLGEELGLEPSTEISKAYSRLIS